MIPWGGVEGTPDVAAAEQGRCWKKPHILASFGSESNELVGHVVLVCQRGAPPGAAVAPGGRRRQGARPRPKTVPGAEQGTDRRIGRVRRIGQEAVQERLELAPVRAQWAGAPFVWQAYRQTDDAHERKLEAFLDRYLGGGPSTADSSIRAVFRAWNGFAPWPAGLPPQTEWREHCVVWRRTLAEQVDLTSQLLRFATERC